MFFVHFLQFSLKTQGIPSMVYYPTSMHIQTAFKNSPFSILISPLENSTKLSSIALSLSMHPYLTNGNILYVVDAAKYSL